MKAVVYTAPGEVSVTDVPTPHAGAGEVLLRVTSNTICGTDLRIAKGLKRKGVIAPRILGHEVAGEIVEVGEGVVDYQVGQTVGVCPTYHCGACRECQRGRYHLCLKAEVLGHQTDGGLASHLLIPAHGVAEKVLVPFHGDIDPAALSLAEPLSCVIHGQRFLNISVGDTVVIMGGGAIGLLHAQVARLSGASRVILSEPMEFRRSLATQFGVDRTVDPTTENLHEVVASLTDGHGADVVIVCIGINALVNEALTLSARHGRVSLFAGFPADELAQMDANLIHYRELTVVGSSNSTVTDYHSAVDLLERGAVVVDPLITHRFTLDQYEQAVDTISAPDALKVAIIP